MNRNGKKRVRIVLPAYNEERSLDPSARRLHAYCSRELEPYDWTVLVVDNGSTDATGKVADELGERLEGLEVLHLPRAGRGGALRRAACQPGADYLLYTDVDLSADLVAVPRLLRALDDGADLAVGTRLHPASWVRRRLHREVLSRGYNRLLQGLFGVRSFRDAQCGLKAWRLERLEPVLDRVRDDQWFFDTELLVLAEYGGFEIVEVPVAWTEDTDSRVHLPSAIVGKIRGVIRLKRTALRNGVHRGKPG